MVIKDRVEKRKAEKMSDSAFRIMELIFKIVDLLYPYIKKRVKNFGIKEGMTVVDHGCGPGRYSIKFDLPP